MSTKSKKGRRGALKEKKYSSDDLISAIAAVQDGMSQREASRTWKIPRTTLIDSCLRLIYFSIVYPYLIYCNVIWGNTFYSSLKPLIIAHKKIIRTMSFARRYDHSDPLFIRYNILNYDKLHLYCKAIFVYKNLNNLITYNLYSRSTYDNLNLRNSMNLQPPQMRSEMGLRSIIYNGCAVWNNLSREIQLSESLPLFKNRLRLMLMSSNGLI